MTQDLIGRPDAALPAWLTTAGTATEMGGRVRDFDWGASPLGPPDKWSPALRAAVSTTLNSCFPMLVVWGPERIMVYNDAYRPMLGATKHPDALGAPAERVWAEIWDVIGPLFDDVMATGRPTWSEHERFIVERNGYPEECYFTYSYSPLFEDDGTVGGVLDIATETTREVLAHRRLACLAQLHAALADAEQVIDVCVRAANALRACTEDLPAVDVYLSVGGQLTRVASSRRDDAPPTDPRSLAAVAASHGSLAVPAGPGIGPHPPAAHYLAGLGASGTVQGVLDLDLNRRLPFDEAYAEFADVVASAIGAALQSTYRRQVELGEYRTIADTLQQAMLEPSSNLPTVAARYLPATGGLAVGGDWYDVIELSGERRALVVGDCVGHGLEAATVMAQLRSAARALLLEGRDPARTLEGLDLFASSLPGAYCATAAVLVVDRHGREVTYSRAGHPPPLVIGAGGSRWLDGAVAFPLGVDPGIARHNATERLHPADVLVLYSDGLVERRGELLSDGLERLADAAGALIGRSVQDIADGLLRSLLADGAGDDVVLVVKQLPGPDGD
ncbi:MAG: serine/threonine-protein phosphatase [Acidimicrobiales bacterium]|nr:serine/threonine-protein phosphatase [Acidimicrobiales bacterium]